jgi:hypothetical protein
MVKLTRTRRQPRRCGHGRISPKGWGGYIDHKLGHRAAGAHASLNLGQVVDQERQRSIGLLHQAIIMATWSAGRG